MFKKTEQIAWGVLILAFLTCIGLTIGTPLTIRWYLLNNTRPLDVRLQPRNGTVTQQKPRSTIKAVVPGDTEVTRDDIIELSNDGSAFLLFYKGMSGGNNTDQPPQPLITVQLNGDTKITVEHAWTPRFTMSKLPHAVTLNVQHGANLHITVEGNDRSTRLYLQTPNGTIRMEEGTYAAVVGAARTEFTVISGRAHLSDPATGEEPVLIASQHTELTAEGIGEIWIGERNVLRNRNGGFEAPLEEYWKIEHVHSPEEPQGTVRQIRIGNDRQIVLFERFGRSHAQTIIKQEIGQDIRGAKSLYVRARVRVDTQTLGVCGSLGTECPIMIRIYFTDQTGNPRREWLQGFYALPGTDSPLCLSCEWKAEHIQVPQASVWYNYESDDLLPLFLAQNIEPVSIESVEVYASGHIYSSAIDEIAILVGE